jgi:hypothetical protein
LSAVAASVSGGVLRRPLMISRLLASLMKSYPAAEWWPSGRMAVSRGRVMMRPAL